MYCFAKVALAGVMSVALTGSLWAAGKGTGGQGGTGSTGSGAGKTGTYGTQGTRSTQGATGTQGTTGTSGTQGATGTQGAGGIGQTPWFSSQNLRGQLGLNDQQYNQLNSAYGQAYSNYSSNMGQLGNSLTPEQR